MTGNRNPRQGSLKRLWTTWAIAALLMALTAGWIFVQERQTNLDLAEAQLRTELTYLQHVIATHLRNGSLDQIGELVDAWSKLNTETQQLMVVADNGYVIAAYAREPLAKRVTERTITIPYSYQSSAKVTLTKSLAGIHSHIAALGFRLLLGTLFFQSFVLLMIYQLYRQREKTQLAREEYEKRIALQSSIERIAKEDALTGLPNRRQLEETLHSRVAEAKRQKHRLAVLFVDLDNFKQINDSFGHDVGDQLLKVTAERMRKALRLSDLMGRFGGDEFVVVLSNIIDNLEVEHVANKLLESMRPPVQLANSESFVSATIGISLFPEDADETADLLRHADAAMYKAKENGRDCFSFFTAGINDDMRKAREIEDGLHRGLASNELYLVYQPKLDLKTQEITSCEALLRWRHDGVNVPPGEFIPIAERSVLMRQIEDFVIEEAVRQRAQWAKAGIEHLRIDINLSGRRLLIGDTLNRLLELTRVYGLAQDQIGIEITEHTLIEAGEETIDALTRLRAKGCPISLDDFGTGYSSLGYLKRLPIDVLKIDRSFIRELPGNRQDISIVSAICAMGHSLDKQVLAEGVETESQMTCISGAGRCDSAQGYLISRPIPPDEFIVWLKDYRASARTFVQHG